MATRKCGNIYFRKYFMAVRKFTKTIMAIKIHKERTGQRWEDPAC